MNKVIAKRYTPDDIEFWPAWVSEAGGTNGVSGWDDALKEACEVLNAEYDDGTLPQVQDDDEFDLLEVSLVCSVRLRKR